VGRPGRNPAVSLGGPSKPRILRFVALLEPASSIAARRRLPDLPSFAKVFFASVVHIPGLSVALVARRFFFATKFSRAKVSAAFFLFVGFAPSAVSPFCCRGLLQRCGQSPVVRPRGPVFR
jgi:hypothetical protein